MKEKHIEKLKTEIFLQQKDDFFEQNYYTQKI